MHFDSLKVVSEHLIERIKLEEPFSRDTSSNTFEQLEVNNNKNNMNNLMCSTMFLMNESLHQNASLQSHAHMNVKKLDAPGSFNMPITYDKGCRPTLDAANSFFRTGMFSPEKHFMMPRGHIQFSAQECGEFFLKKSIASNIPSGSEGATAPTVLHGNSNNACNDRHLNKHLLSASDMTSVGSPKESDNSLSNSSSEIGLPVKSHKVQVAKQRPFSCLECGKSFLLKHHLVTHARVHSGERPHVCTECGKNFAHKHCLSTHLLLHTTQRPYKCSECNKSFTLKHHLVTHSRIHSRDRPFLCQECGRTFPQKRHLVTHAKFHSGERPYVCGECNESFSQKDHLVIHSRFHGCLHPYVCADCGVAFMRKFELVNHARLHGRQPLACTVCGKEFLQKRTLLAHARLHLEQEHHPHICPQCGRIFPLKSDLTEHLEVHCQEKTFHCHNFSPVPPHFLCPTPVKTSLAPVMLSAAVQTDTVTKPKPHVCPVCGKCFTQKHGLAQHNRRHGESGGCEVRSHVCDKCGKAFFQKNHLTLHSLQHRTLDQINAKIKSEESAQCESVDVRVHLNLNPPRNIETAKLGSDDIGHQEVSHSTNLKNT